MNGWFRINGSDNLVYTVLNEKIIYVFQFY